MLWKEQAMVGRQNTALVCCIVICFANGPIACPTQEDCAFNASQRPLSMTYGFGCLGGFSPLPYNWSDEGLGAVWYAAPSLSITSRNQSVHGRNGGWGGCSLGSLPFPVQWKFREMFKIRRCSAAPPLSRIFPLLMPSVSNECPHLQMSNSVVFEGLGNRGGTKRAVAPIITHVPGRQTGQAGKWMSW